MAHAKITTPNQKKLNDQSAPYVYLGVEEGSKAHRLFDPRRGRIHVSRDVIFEENVPWQWSAVAWEQNSTEFTVEDDGADALPAGAPVSSVPQYRAPSPGGHHGREEIPSSPPASLVGASPTLPTSLQSSPSTTPPSTPATSSAGPVASPGSGGDPGSDEGPVRFRSLEDIMGEAPRVDLVEDEHDGDALLAEMEEPSSYREAAGQPAWENAMAQEMQAIEKNSTWALTALPAGHKPIGLKWVYKLKNNTAGEVIKHKARLVAKGYVQRQGVDFEEVFVPVAWLDTVRVILAVVADWRWEVHHLDVKSAFLNGDLQEEVYIAQPEGFVKKGEEHLVLRLSKALYGLCQAPQAWNTRLDKCLKELGFARCMQEQAVYTRGKGQAGVIVGVYVDDLIVTGENPQEIAMFKKQMMGGV